MSNVVDDEMRQVFLNCLYIYQVEKNYNYSNYGKYPYKERKNSVQIIADFNANAYSVNGLFTEETSYEMFYPSQIIESIEDVLARADNVYGEFYATSIDIVNSDDGNIDSVTIEYAKEIIASYDIYEPIITREYIEAEAVEVQAIRYLFPFVCVPNSLGRLVLSL